VFYDSVRFRSASCTISRRLSVSLCCIRYEGPPQLGWRRLRSPIMMCSPDILRAFLSVRRDSVSCVSEWKLCWLYTLYILIVLGSCWSCSVCTPWVRSVIVVKSLVWCVSDHLSVWILLLMYMHTLESLSSWSLVWKRLKRGLYGALLNGFLYGSWVAMMLYDAISGSWRRPIKTFVQDLFTLYCKILRLCLLVVFNILGFLCWLGFLSAGSQCYGSVQCLV